MSELLDNTTKLLTATTSALTIYTFAERTVVIVPAQSIAIFPTGQSIPMFLVFGTLAAIGIYYLIKNRRKK